MKRRLIAIPIALLIGLVPLATAWASPEIDQVYAEGQTYDMLGATLLTQGTEGLLSAPPLYLIGYPVSSSQTGPLVLASGFSPQCDPCNHSPFHYHDHVLPGVPGAGTTATAGVYKGPWRIVVLAYNPAYYNLPSFVPLKSDDAIAQAEWDQVHVPNAPHVFLPINGGGANPFEIWTTQVLICPIVSPAA